MTPSPAAYEDVPADEWESWVAVNGAIILDVRQPEEWHLGTLNGAVTIPMGDIPERLGEIPKGRAILCVCRSGARSARVASFLSDSGYESVANMAGGMKALGLQP